MAAQANIKIATILSTSVSTMRTVSCLLGGTFLRHHMATACDGIGGTNNQILNPHDVFTFCNTKIPGIEF